MDEDEEVILKEERLAKRNKRERTQNTAFFADWFSLKAKMTQKRIKVYFTENRFKPR